MGSTQSRSFEYVAVAGKTLALNVPDFVFLQICGQYRRGTAKGGPYKSFVYLVYNLSSLSYALYIYIHRHLSVNFPPEAAFDQERSNYGSDFEEDFEQAPGIVSGQSSPLEAFGARHNHG